MKGNFLRSIALLLGLYYTLFIGFLNIPLNLGGAVFFVFLIAIFFSLLIEKKIPFKTFGVFSIIGILTAIYLLFTTNMLVLVITFCSLVFILSMLSIGNLNGRIPLTVTEYAQGLGTSLSEGMIHVLTFKRAKDFFSFNVSTLKSLPLKKDYVMGSLIAFPFLCVFHALFAQVNHEYAIFMADILKRIGDIIHYLIDLDIIQVTIKTLISGYFFYLIFSLNTTEKDEVSGARSYTSSDIIKIFVSLLVLLFAVFSFFQGKLITTMNFTALPFKQLSLYTQQGFWELMVISLVGYILSLIFVRFIIPVKTVFSVKNMLLLYLSELLLITIFSFHKLYFLQYLFGFKDQRMLATGAVSLIFLTFVLLLFRMYGKISSHILFSIQSIGFIVLVLAFNVMNIDMVASTINPIRYYVGEKTVTDYSYLLGNSYDNNSMWLSLMKDAEKKGIPQPTNYYWGWYKSLCFGDRDYSGYYVQEYSSYIEKRYAYINKKYSGNNSLKELEKIGGFNVSEYEAYVLLKTHKGEVKKFLEFVYTNCGYR